MVLLYMGFVGGRSHGIIHCRFHATQLESGVICYCSFWCFAGACKTCYAIQTSEVVVVNPASSVMIFWLHHKLYHKTLSPSAGTLPSASFVVFHRLKITQTMSVCAIFQADSLCSFKREVQITISNFFYHPVQPGNRI